VTLTKTAFRHFTTRRRCYDDDDDDDDDDYVFVRA
jgi:hypothetical protein